MAKLKKIIARLEKHISAVESTLIELRKADGVVIPEVSVETEPAKVPAGKRVSSPAGKRVLSVEARQRMANAQKKRWAKVKKAAKKAGK